MEEHERAVLTFRNVSDESVSSAIEVGMVLNSLGDSERERHDFKAEVINISRTLANRWMLMPCRRAGACKGRGSETRICHICGETWTRDERLFVWQRQQNWKQKKKARKARTKVRTKAVRAQEREVSRVNAGLRTLPTVGNADNLVTTRETA